MNINSQSNIDFSAKFLNNAVIKKFDREAKQFLPHKVSFIELEPQNCADVEAVDKIFDNWGKADLIYKIKSSFEIKHFYPAESFASKFYGITTQKSEFDELKPEQIMGIVEVAPETDKEIYLEFLQVKPELKSGSTGRGYKNIGSAILNSLKEMFDEIRLCSLKKSAKFYEINGFEPKAKGSFKEHVWERVPSDVIEY